MPKMNPPRGGFQKPKNAKRTLFRLLKYFGQSYALLAAVALMLIVATVSTLAGSYMLKPLINDYIVPGDFKGLAAGLAVLALIYALGAAAQYGQTRIMVQVAQKTTYSIRRELFEKMQELPIAFFDGHTHGEIMSRFTNDVDAVQMMLEQTIVQFVTSILTFIGTLVMMFVLSPTLMLVTICVLAVMIFVTAKIGIKSKKHFAEQQKALGKANGYVEESIEGLKVVKTFTREHIMEQEFDVLIASLKDSSLKAQVYSSVIMPIMGNLGNINYALTAMIGSALAMVGRFDLGSLASFLVYSRQFGMPVQQITMQANNLLAALAGAERIFEVMDTQPETDEGSVTLVKTSGSEWAWKRGEELIPLKGDVRFEHVTFGYVPEKTVLSDVSLYAKPGQKIAFVGSTGAGKTTITNLINRFYDIQQGVITFDGIDVKDIKKADLRHSVGIVLQDTHLFTGTVMDNIRYGNPDASDEDVLRAARLANAHSFIKRLPEGYNTMLTGDGANLSQGQRQLLSIARTACADPPVLILDEATSSIDTRTERLIEKGMDSLMKGRTTFVIAHRLSTVRNSNAIMVLENGVIIERGDHDDLIAQKGRYYKLHSGQFELD